MTTIDFQTKEVQVFTTPGITNRGAGNQSQTPTLGKTVYDPTTKVAYYGDGVNFVNCIGGATIPTGTNTGDVTLTIANNTPNVNGAILTGQQLSLSYANAANPGLLSHVAQQVNGIKSFTTGLAIANIDPAVQSQYNDPTNGFIYAEQSQGSTLPPLALSGDGFATSQNVAWSLQKVGRIITLGFSSPTPLTLSGGNALIASANGVVPVEFRPATSRVKRCNVQVGGVFQTGVIMITTSGQIFFGANIASTVPTITNFVAANAAPVDDCIEYVN